MAVCVCGWVLLTFSACDMVVEAGGCLFLSLPAGHWSLRWEVDNCWFQDVWANILAWLLTCYLGVCGLGWPDHKPWGIVADSQPHYQVNFFRQKHTPQDHCWFVYLFLFFFVWLFQCIFLQVQQLGTHCVFLISSYLSSYFLPPFLFSFWLFFFSLHFYPFPPVISVITM